MAANNNGAGFFATLTAATLDQDVGADAVALMNTLTRAHRRYQQYWLAFGTDAVLGYQALKTSAGGTQALTDYNNASTAASLMEKLYQVMLGNATIAVDNTNTGNGVVTIGATGSGFNFVTFFNRVAGDQVG